MTSSQKSFARRLLSSLSLLKMKNSSCLFSLRPYFMNSSLRCFPWLLVHCFNSSWKYIIQKKGIPFLQLWTLGCGDVFYI